MISSERFCIKDLYLKKERTRISPGRLCPVAINLGLAHIKIKRSIMIGLNGAPPLIHLLNSISGRGNCQGRFVAPLGSRLQGIILPTVRKAYLGAGYASLW